MTFFWTRSLMLTTVVGLAVFAAPAGAATFAVTTANDVAVAAAGGNAVDAAVAATFAISVTSPSTPASAAVASRWCTSRAVTDAVHLFAQQVRALATG